MNSFNLHLPSNTPVPGNTPSLFRIRLPHRIVFNSQWMVGLSVINYPHTFMKIGTSEDQSITLNFKNGESLLLKIPSGKYTTPEELLNSVNNILIKKAEKYRKEVEDLEKNKKPTPAWLHVYSKMNEYITLSYEGNIHRYVAKIHPRYVKDINLTSQLKDVMGFQENLIPTGNTIATQTPNLLGEIGLIFVYTPGLIDPVTIGNVTAPLLRVVNVKNKKSAFIEEMYENIQYHKLLTKDISEISVELRTATGELIDFKHGCVLLTLHFKKMPML